MALEELRERGMHAGYGKQLERRLRVIVSRGKTLWPQAADQQLGGLAWVRAACAPRPTATPLLSLNHFSLSQRVNAICCARVSILLFGRRPGAALKRPPTASGSRCVASLPSSPPPEAAMTPEQRAHRDQKITEFRYQLVGRVGNPYLSAANAGN